MTLVGEGDIYLFDGTSETVELEKSVEPHIISLERKGITWLTFGQLIKADDPSPFPALTQIEVYGRGTRGCIIIGKINILNNWIMVRLCCGEICKYMYFRKKIFTHNLHRLYITGGETILTTYEISRIMSMCKEVVKKW